MREFIVDWFQCTLFPKDGLKKEILSNCYGSCYDDFNILYINYLFKKFFNIDSSLLVKSKGFNGYDICYSYRNIKLMGCSYRSDMGFNLMLSGQACRDYEDLNLNWVSLCQSIMIVCDHFNFNRIDIAIDSINSNDYTIDKLYGLIRCGLCCTKFKKCINIDSLIISSNESTGRNLQFGSKSSDIEITFYDKLNERKNAGYDVDVVSWFRCELRFRHDNAYDIFLKILEGSFISDYILAILYNYIDFKVVNGDSNLSRRKTAPFWLKFVSDSSKLKLSTRSSESSIVKKKLWLCNSVNKTELLVYLADLKTCNNLDVDIDYILSFISIGVDNISFNDLSLINDYRISKNLVPYTLDQLKDYCSNVLNIKR